TTSRPGPPARIASSRCHPARTTTTSRRAAPISGTGAKTERSTSCTRSTAPAWPCRARWSRSSRITSRRTAPSGYPRRCAPTWAASTSSAEYLLCRGRKPPTASLHMAVALLDPLSRLDPPHRPDWRSELTTAQFGPMAEDLLAVCIEAAGSGSATIARPIVDRGIDLYVRRLRSLLTIPIQVKAFQHLSPDGNGNLDLPVTDVAEDPNGYLAMVHLPAPYDQLYRRLFLIPFREFRERCPRALIHGRECFSFTGNFSTTSHDLWSDYFFDIDRLPEWLASAPGWATPIPPVPHPPRPHDVSEGDGLTQWRGDIGRLWTATELERAGAASIVLAQDRVRLDTVTLLIHDLSSRHIAGL